MELNGIIRMLFEFQKIPKHKRSRTFLEISGYPHYENVCSNILKFYLQPDNEHGLKDLILYSLIQPVANDFKVNCDFEKVEINREFPTLSGNRIDLLIETDNFVIGIENKIFHFLNNDLYDYDKTVLALCQQNKKKPINIILSLNKLTSQEDLANAKDNNFVNITYLEFFTNIKKNIGSFLSHSNPTYTIYLTDFMKSIQNLIPATMEDKALWHFFKDHSELVKELSDKYSDYRNYVFAKAEILKNFLPQEESSPFSVKPWIWDGRKEGYDCVSLVHDYNIENYQIAVDAFICIKGWSIELLGRNQSSKEYLFNQMCADKDFLQKPFDQYERNDRLIIHRFDTEVEVEIVATTLKDLLIRIEKYKEQTESKNLN